MCTVPHAALFVKSIVRVCEIQSANTHNGVGFRVQPGGLNVYDKIISFVAAGREAYKSKQSKLLDMLRAYESYRATNYIRSFFVGQLGFPALRAQIGTRVVRGQEALDQMMLIVTTEGGQKSYQTGTMKPLSVNEK